MSATKKNVRFFRPRDKSLEAFKEYVLAICKHLTGKEDDDMSEEEWRKAHAEFWGKGKH